MNENLIRCAKCQNPAEYTVGSLELCEACVDTYNLNEYARNVAEHNARQSSRQRIGETIAAAVEKARAALPLEGYDGMHDLDTLTQCCAFEAGIDGAEPQLYELFVHHFRLVYTQLNG